MFDDEENTEEENTEEVEGEEGAEGDGEEGEAESSGSKKKLIIILVLVLVLVGGGAGAFFMGLIPGLSSKNDSQKELVVPKIIYYDLQEFLVNLNTPGKQVSFLKMIITLELPSAHAKALVEAKLPRVRDSFQVYLRELRSADLKGSAGLVRLREELLLRINKILETERVTDILFKEIIVQ